ncbi:MAG: FAD-dependent oxidoreductase [Chloroflexi bacterium]|nr:MAG: FAD-dependent oxidoreductase [Chloroflexota bacterium]
MVVTNAAVVKPRSADELANSLREAAAAGKAVTPVGGGRAATMGGPLEPREIRPVSPARSVQLARSYRRRAARWRLVRAAATALRLRARFHDRHSRRAARRQARERRRARRQECLRLRPDEAARRRPRLARHHRGGVVQGLPTPTARHHRRIPRRLACCRSGAVAAHGAGRARAVL